MRFCYVTTKSGGPTSRLVVTQPLRTLVELRVGNQIKEMWEDTTPSGSGAHGYLHTNCFWGQLDTVYYMTMVDHEGFNRYVEYSILDWDVLDAIGLIQVQVRIRVCTTTRDDFTLQPGQMSYL